MPHDVGNVVFREVTQGGIPLEALPPVKLPLPSMADGLDSAAQNKVLEQIGGERFAPDRLLQKSVVAPHVLELPAADKLGETVLLRRVNFWFIAYGKLKTLSSQEFVDSLLSVSNEGDTARSLTREELKKFDILLANTDPQQESYGHVRFTLFDKVVLQLTGHTHWTRNDESLIAAMVVDPRFRDDPELASRWQLLHRQEDGDLKPGETGKFPGGGLYIKITQLKAPQDALFVEGHLIIAEPEVWFGGANLVGSKLPPLIQTRVRELRRKSASTLSTVPSP